jgi:hypothetical protein
MLLLFHFWNHFLFVVTNHQFLLFRCQLFSENDRSSKGEIHIRLEYTVRFSILKLTRSFSILSLLLLLHLLYFFIIISCCECCFVVVVVVVVVQLTILYLGRNSTSLKIVWSLSWGKSFLFCDFFIHNYTFPQFVVFCALTHSLTHSNLLTFLCCCSSILFVLGGDEPKSRSGEDSRNCRSQLPIHC